MMILLIISIIAFAVMVDNFLHEEDKNGYISFIVMVVSLGLAICMLCVFNNQDYTRVEEPYTQHELIAINDGTVIKGRMYYRRGYINETWRYTYYYETNTGGIKIQEANADTTTIYLTNEVSPKAIWYKEIKQFLWMKNERSVCDIYVPTDSITTDYILDLEE